MCRTEYAALVSRAGLKLFLSFFFSSYSANQRRQTIFVWGYSHVTITLYANLIKTKSNPENPVINMQKRENTAAEDGLRST